MRWIAPVPRSVLGESLEREVAMRMKKDDSLESVTSILGLFVDDAVVSLIDAILAPQFEAQLVHLASRSYEHTFGFSKLVLMEKPGAYKVRLHAWPQGGRESDIHDHRWNFGSRVLRGGYRFEEYVIRPGEGWHCYRYRPTAGAAHFGLEGLGTCDVACVRRGHVLPDAGYSLGVGTAHRVWTHSAEPTVSLVIQGRDLQQSTTVLTREPRSAQQFTQVPVERLDPARYRQLLSQIRTRLLEPCRPAQWVG